MSLPRRPITATSSTSQSMRRETWPCQGMAASGPTPRPAGRAETWCAFAVVGEKPHRLVPARGDDRRGMTGQDVEYGLIARREGVAGGAVADDEALDVILTVGDGQRGVAGVCELARQIDHLLERIERPLRDARG